MCPSYLSTEQPTRVRPAGRPGKPCAPAGRVLGEGAAPPGRWWETRSPGPHPGLRSAKRAEPDACVRLEVWRALSVLSRPCGLRFPALCVAGASSCLFAAGLLLGCVGGWTAMHGGEDYSPWPCTSREQPPALGLESDACAGGHCLRRGRACRGRALPTAAPAWRCVARGKSVSCVQPAPRPGSARASSRARPAFVLGEHFSFGDCLSASEGTEEWARSSVPASYFCTSATRSPVSQLSSLLASNFQVADWQAGTGHGCDGGLGGCWSPEDDEVLDTARCPGCRGKPETGLLTLWAVSCAAWSWAHQICHFPNLQNRDKDTQAKLSQSLCVCVSHSVVWLFATPRTAALQAALSMELSKDTGVGCHFVLQGIVPTQGSNPSLLCLLHRQAGSSLLALPGKPRIGLYQSVFQ